MNMFTESGHYEVIILYEYPGHDIWVNTEKETNKRMKVTGRVEKLRRIFSGVSFKKMPVTLRLDTNMHQYPGTKYWCGSKPRRPYE